MAAHRRSPGRATCRSWDLRSKIIFGSLINVYENRIVYIEVISIMEGNYGKSSFREEGLGSKYTDPSQHSRTIRGRSIAQVTLTMPFWPVPTPTTIQNASHTEVAEYQQCWPNIGNFAFLIHNVPNVYNCIAWSLGMDDRWINPVDQRGMIEICMCLIL